MLISLISVLETEEEKLKFEDIYYKYRDMLFYTAKKYVITDADAEDVLQESFIKIAKHIKAVKGESSRETAAFLNVIVRNTAFDFLRRRSRFNEVAFEETGELADTDSALESVLENSEYENIVSVIKNLPAPYGETLYLHFVRDLNTKQIAKLLDRKPETVKMQLVRGKKLLIKKLSEVEK